MTEQYDTSMIPDDQAYWDALAVRITTGALRRPSIVAWLAASRSAWLAAPALGLAAVLVAAIAPRPTASRPLQSLSAALTPRDQLARALITADAPPMLTTLTLGETRRTARR